MFQIAFLLSTTLMAANGGVEAGFESPKALVTTMIKGISTGNDSICSQFVVDPKVLLAAKGCPKEAHRKILENIKGNNESAVSACKRAIADSKRRGEKVQLISIENNPKKTEITKQGDTDGYCEATTEFSSLRVDAKLQVKRKDKTKEKSMGFSLWKLHDRYYWSEK